MRWLSWLMSAEASRLGTLERERGFAPGHLRAARRILSLLEEGLEQPTAEASTRVFEAARALSTAAPDSAAPSSAPQSAPAPAQISPPIVAGPPSSPGLSPSAPAPTSSGPPPSHPKVDLGDDLLNETAGMTSTPSPLAVMPFQGRGDAPPPAVELEPNPAFGSTVAVQRQPANAAVPFAARAAKPDRKAAMTFASNSSTPPSAAASEAGARRAKALPSEIS